MMRPIRKLSCLVLSCAMGCFSISVAVAHGSSGGSGSSGSSGSSSGSGSSSSSSGSGGSGHGGPGNSASNGSAGNSAAQGYSGSANSAGSSSHGGTNGHGVASHGGSSHGAFGSHGIFGGLFGGHQSHSSSKGATVASRSHTAPDAVPAVHQAATKRTDPPAQPTDPPAQQPQAAVLTNSASETGAVHHRLRRKTKSQAQVTQS
jgi:hypothetical protein